MIDGSIITQESSLQHTADPLFILSLPLPYLAHTPVISETVADNKWQSASFSLEFPFKLLNFFHSYVCYLEGWVFQQKIAEALSFRREPYIHYPCNPVILLDIY